jgi:hypothetical protein
MKRTKTELNLIKSFIDNTYSRFGMRLLVNDDKKYDPTDPDSALGYCFKYTDPALNSVVYKIECSKIGLEDTDFRILMHEYGHIYLGHLEGIHEELDSQICKALEDHREELIDEINQKCGIDFADKLLERIIDDPQLNHSLHNIAMDMEVNSSVLSLEDIDEMEMDITSILPKYEEELLKYIGDQTDDEEVKKQIQDQLNKYQSESKIKLIHPSRYHLDENTVFPDNLTYTEYLFLILQNLDQFVKMLVSIKMGGNGDTSNISQQDIQDALNNILDKLQGKSEAYKQGYRDAIRDAQQQQGQNQGQSQGQGQPNSQPQQQGQNQGQQSQNQSSGDGGASNSQGQGQQSTPGNGGTGSGSGQGDQSGMGNQPSAGAGGSSSSQDQADYEQGYQDALRDLANAQNSGMGQNGMQSLSDLMNDMGMSSPTSNSSGSQSSGQGQDGSSSPGGSGKNGKSSMPYEGMREDPNAHNYSKDHRTDSRDQADKKRELGQIRSAGGVGCGSGGGPGYTREVEKNLDDVEMALQEVMQNVKKRVVKMATTKDNMKNYNRGIIRTVIAPSFSRKITICNDPKIVYLIDISGSMDTKLIDRCLGTIARSMKKLSRGLKYDIITWSTHLGEHIKDIDPKKPITRVSGGGGTSIARGIKYFKDNYGPEAILVIISDFEDYLQEWHEVESTMDEYSMYGFNYGGSSYYDSDKITWKNLKVRKFKDY